KPLAASRGAKLQAAGEIVTALTAIAISGMIRRHVSFHRRAVAALVAGVPAPRVVARPFPRRRRRPDPLPLVRLAPLADLARLAPLPLHVVLPLRAGRGPLRRDPARDAPARRMGGAVSARRTVPRQAAAAVLAGDARSEERRVGKECREREVPGG